LLDNDGIDGITVHVTTSQSVAFEEDPRLGGYSASSFMESQRDGSDCIPVSMEYKVYSDSNHVRFSCVTLGDVLEYSKLPDFQQRTESINYCRLDGLHEPEFSKGGYMVLICEGDHGSLMLKLLVFPLRAADGIASPVERAIILPKDIKINDIISVGFDEVSGILVLHFAESSDIHLVHLVGI
jgi:hypothetical protein